MVNSVKIIDVTARDGLQDAGGYVPISDKVQLVQGLYQAGVHSIEVTSFVHPRWIPLLADGEKVLAEVHEIPAEWIALVPNVKGVRRAIAAGARTVTLVVSASESHNRANLNRSREETLAILQDAAALARQAGLRVRGAISTAFECPFEGKVPLGAVVDMAERYCRMGVDELGLADTFGTATPTLVKERVGVLRQALNTVPLALHLHDRLGWGLDNVEVAYDAGVRIFEAALGGLGGCPYAPGAAGNLDIEKLVGYFHARGIVTGIDLSRLPPLRKRLLGVIDRKLPPPTL